MSRRTKRDPKRVGGMVGRVLADLGHTGAAPAFALFDAWDQALGDAAEHCEPVDLRLGVLEVAVDSSVWAQHLQMRRAEILRSLADAMGEGAPTDLRFRVR
ncbi:MAG: DUF721 domain-containing protein [bacterium]|nr:DUF721 domain-containing protein [bacterium]